MPKECSFFLISIEIETKANASSHIEFYGSKKAGWYDPAFFAHRRKPEQNKNQTSAMHSTSQSTFFGSVLTATQERAGLFTMYFP